MLLGYVSDERHMAIADALVEVERNGESVAVVRSSPRCAIHVGTALLAKGLNPEGGGGEIVYRETPSGGAVFSVGSITYVASMPVDPAVSRVTANVLGRLLLGGADVAPPSVP